MLSVSTGDDSGQHQGTQQAVDNGLHTPPFDDKKTPVKSVNFLSFYHSEELSDRTLILVEQQPIGAKDLMLTDEKEQDEEEHSLSQQSTMSTVSTSNTVNTQDMSIICNSTVDSAITVITGNLSADSDGASFNAVDFDSSSPARKRAWAETNKTYDSSEGLTAVVSSKRSKHNDVPAEQVNSVRESSQLSPSEPYRLPIHSIIFCANSEYFRHLLMSNNAMSEANERNIKICLSKGELQPFLKLAKLFYQHDKELMICNDNDKIDEAEKISEIISLLKLADKFLCQETITFLHELCTDFEPTQVSTLNIIIDFVSKIQTCGATTLHDSCEFWTAPCLRYLTSGKTRIFPLESVLAQDLRKFVEEASLETIEFVVGQAGANVLKQNSLVTFCVFALEQKQASEEEIKVILEALCVDSLKDASFIANTLTSHHPFLCTWKDYTKWYTTLLEQVVISPSPRSCTLNPVHSGFMKNCLNWPIVKFVANDDTYSSLDASEWIMKSDTPGPHVLGNGYLFSLVSVVLKKAAGYARHFQVSFQVDIMNIKATPHAELKFLFQCCPRALGGGPSKNEHPWDSDVTVPPYDTTFRTTPFTMTSTRPITFSHFKDMYFHICII